MKIGFIGLGHLGKTIARHLIDEGMSITVWNRTKEKATDLGVPVASNPAELINKVDVVILNLFDSEAVESVLSGKNGLLSGNCKGKIIVDTTTNHFESAVRFHSVVCGSGASYLECPVLGSVGPASQGALTVLVSGQKSDFERSMPILERMGKKIFWLEEPGLAIKMKLINTLVLGSLMAAGAEAVALGESAGIPREEVIDILLAGAGNSAVLIGKRDNFVRAEFPTQFSSALIYKDLHYLQDLCRAIKRPLLTGSIIKEVYAMARSKNIEGEDFSAVYRVFREN